jgi:broad specificity phosphatase PhoE
MITRFLLIRHGQTEWNRVERFRGHADIPLNETGLAQAQKIAARLADESIAAIYSSPLQRALQTAQPLADAQHLQVQKCDALIDMHVGALEGLTLAEARQAFPEVMDKWLNAPGHVKFPKGESMKAVRTRLEKLLGELSAQHAGQTIALVTHRLVCHVTLLLALGLNLDSLWRIRQDNACVNVFEKREDRFVVTLMNDTRHLQENK